MAGEFGKFGNAERSIVVGIQLREVPVRFLRSAWDIGATGILFKVITMVPVPVDLLNITTPVEEVSVLFAQPRAVEVGDAVGEQDPSLQLELTDETIVVVIELVNIRSIESVMDLSVGFEVVSVDEQAPDALPQ